MKDLLQALLSVTGDIEEQINEIGYNLDCDKINDIKDIYCEEFDVSFDVTVKVEWEECMVDRNGDNDYWDYTGNYDSWRLVSATATTADNEKIIIPEDIIYKFNDQ